MATQVKDFLVEIHTEELPPKALRRLAKAFLTEMVERVGKAELAFKDAQFFATPRRLAVWIHELAPQQADTVVERKGPALEAAFNKEGQPTPACLGFAKSCGVTPDQLTTIKNNGGAWVGFSQHVKGKTVQELLPNIVQQALAALPIPKRMRWGSNTAEFVRPVHSVLMLYGNDIVDATILNHKTDRRTRGHRFLSPGWLEIANPAQYVSQLEKAFVIADFNQRKEIIREKTLLLAKKHAVKVVMTDELLDEVTGLVEWPNPIYGSFDRKFLNVPQEALISAMQDHQRYFPIVDDSNTLLANFITVSNIDGKDMSRVVAGNERVLRARLSDAAFFFETDRKISLEQRVDILKNIIFQAKLGTLFEKTQRISALASAIATKIKSDAETAERAGWLAKADLTTELVGEFPELQGIAGYYYALNDGEVIDIAIALKEQYQPRFSGDTLPTIPTSFTLALADRLDTLIGVFGINQAPTGDKDPFGLRRAALGVLRILIEKQLDLDLQDLLQLAAEQYTISLENKNVVSDTLNFMLDRLKPWYQEQGITSDVFAAVLALEITNPYDIDRRVRAVQSFKKLADAESLSIANKRVSNILAQYKRTIPQRDIDEKLFESDAERTLTAKLKEQQASIAALSKSAEYQKLLSQLAELRVPVDDFFDHVMVMTEDQAKQENRILMLKKLRELFLHVADIALLQ
jgi:glycyl-tRNA synthetase beta chain